jgi:outer membrane biosynthesis protein TonB
MISTVGQQTSSGTGPLRPSRYWYLIAGGLLAIAVVCLTAAVIGMFSWDRQIQDFQRVPVPGQGEVTLTQPGQYVLYVETLGSCCSWALGSQDTPLAGWSMRLAMGPANGSRETPVSSWTGMPESYGVGGHQGLTAMSFTITQPGTYLIETGNVHPASVTDLAVGRNILGPTLQPLVLLVAGLSALLGAVVAFAFTAARRRTARRRQGQPPAVPEPGLWPPASGASGASAPVLVGFAGPARQGRWTVLLRAILAIPAVVCLYFVRYVAGVVLVTGWFAALFTGRLPDYAASFLTGFQRWEVRAYAYLLLLTSTYPPFGLLDADYPVSVTISPGRLNRAAVLFRLVLVFPAWVVATILWYGLGLILMIPTWLIVLIRGRMPRPLYEAIAACLCYWARMRAYWYLLTDVYPDGLFGDPAGPALRAAGPAATWAPAEAGSAAWAPPSVSGPEPPQPEPPQPEPPQPEPPQPEPPQPEPVPMDHPVPLPADAVGPAAAPTATAVPERLVLSDAGKWLVGLILGVGAAVPVALIALLVVQLAQAPSAGPAPASVPVAAARPSATTALAPSASPAPAPSSAPPSRPLSTTDWLNGLSSLSADMTSAMGAGSQVITSASLRSTARQLSRCSAELSALGPPTTQLRQVDRLTVRACQGFEQGARYFAAAARFMSPDGAATNQGKLNRLLDRGDAGFNKGSNLMSTAVADGSFIGTPG